MSDEILPLLGGEPILGHPDRLTAALFVGTAAQADAWLGNPEGTTRYRPCQRGPAIAVTGWFTGPDAATIAAARQQLVALAGSQPCRAVLPTGYLSQRPQWRWDAWEGCRFGPTDLIFPLISGPFPAAAFPPVAFPAGGFAQAPPPLGTYYRLLLRTTGPTDSAGAWRPPQTGIMQPQPNGSTWRVLNPPFEPDQHV